MLGSLISQRVKHLQHVYGFNSLNPNRYFMVLRSATETAGLKSWALIPTNYTVKLSRFLTHLWC